MSKSNPMVVRHLAKAMRVFQEQQTGRTPNSVTIVLSDDTLVVAMHGVLSPDEQTLAKNPQGAADLHEYYQHLFRNSDKALRKEVKRLTGRDVHEAAAEIDPAMGTIVHAFTTGSAVQVFLFAEDVSPAVCVQDTAAAMA